MARTNLTTFLPGLRSFMDDHKVTQVARDIGINQATLSLLVNQKRGASLAMALRLADYFGTTVEVLADDKIIQAVN